MRSIVYAILLSATVCASLAHAGETAEAPFQFRLLELDGERVSWAVPASGLPAIVTYAFLSAPRSFAGARNCGSMLPAENALQPSQIASADFRREVRAAFDIWQKAARIEFRETSDARRAGILIGAQAEPRGRAFTNVATNAATTGDRSHISQSLICLNPQMRWKIGFDGNLDIYDLRYTITHEIGHAIGLDHPGREGELMSFRYTERSRELAAGDVMGAVTIYGARAGAPNGVATLATRSLTAPLTAVQTRAPTPPHGSARFGIGVEAE